MQNYGVNEQRGLPVDEVGSSSMVMTVTNETVQLYYYNSGVLTIDAGQLAGVTVVGRLKYDNIKNATGSAAAVFGDSSLGFTAGALTTEVAYDPSVGSLDGLTGYSRATKITSALSNGQYVVDYANGIIYGKKTTNAVTLANATYKIKQGLMLPASDMIGVAFDDVRVTWNGGTFTETFTFKTGGSGGTTVATVTVVYTDGTKAQLVSVTRT